MGAFRAKVSSIDSRDDAGYPATARVVPNTAKNIVTAPFSVFSSLRTDDTAISEGEEVVCIQFEDGTGLILCHPDGM